jgi:hypothetical protein
MVRAVWVKVPDALAEYRVECVMTLDAVAATRAACQQAMASIVLPRMAERQALAAAAPVAAVADEDASGGDDGVAPDPVQPGIRQTPEGIAPVVIEQPARTEEGRDLRPFYLAGGLLLLAGALWWSNQRRKKVLDADDAADAGRAAEAPGPDDLDADLADAAAAPAADPDGAPDAAPEAAPASDRKEDRPQ